MGSSFLAQENQIWYTRRPGALAYASLMCAAAAPLCKSSQQRCWRWTPRGRFTQLTQYAEDTNTARHVDQYRCFYQYHIKPHSTHRYTDSPALLLLSGWGSPLRCVHTLALCGRNTHRFTGSLDMSSGSRSVRSLCLPQTLALTLVFPVVALTS